MRPPVGHNGILFDVDVDWGERYIDKSKTPVKNCHEMVVARDNLIYMIGDHTANNVLVYDADGRLVRTFGTEYPGGHGIEIFQENGEEFLSLVDPGPTTRTERGFRESGRVVKTTLRGEVIFTIGHPLTIGVYEPGWEYRPTEAAVAPNGDILCLMRSGGRISTPTAPIYATPLYQSRSKDNGETWSDPVQIAPLGVNPNAIALENGVLVAPESPAALAEGIVRVLTDHRLRTRLVEGGRRALERYSEPVLIGQIEALYREVTA